MPQVVVTPEVSTTIFVTLGSYLAIVLIIGVILERYVRALIDYVLGGRRLGPYVIGISERASEMSGWVGLGLPGEGFSSGINATWNTLGCFYADLLTWTAVAKRLRRYTEVVGALTIPAYLEVRFNDVRGVLRVVCTIFFVIFLTAYVGAQITASGKLFGAVTGRPELITTWMVVGALVFIVYTLLGGFFAVCWTDFIQGWWALAGLLILASIGFSKYGVPGTFEAMGSVSPKLVDPFSFWGYTYPVGLAVLIMLSYIAIGFGWPGNPHIMVRYMGIKRVGDLKKAAVTALLFLLIVYYSAISIGWFARIEFKEAEALIAPDPEFSIQTLAISWLHPVLAGIILAAPLALMMSTADSQLLVTASAIVEDIYHRFINKVAPERTLVLLGRLATLVLGIIALVWALTFKETVYLFVLFAWGGLGAAFGPAILFTLHSKRLNRIGVLASMITGGAAVILWKSYTKKLIFPTIELMNAYWWAVAAALPIAIFVFTLIGSAIMERELREPLKGSLVALVIAAAIWIPWCYARLVFDPELAAWWYELLIAFPLASVVLYAVSYATKPLPREFVEKQFEYMTKPIRPTSVSGGKVEGEVARVKPLAISEIENVKLFVKAKVLPAVGR